MLVAVKIGSFFRQNDDSLVQNIFPAAFQMFQDAEAVPDVEIAGNV
jgi:hypothetical protein